MVFSPEDLEVRRQSEPPGFLLSWGCPLLPAPKTEKEENPE